MVLPDLSSPLQLWWLALLPVIYWLSLPPRPRKQVTTAHMVQWLGAVRRLRRRPVRFRRLRFWLLVLGFCAVVSALSGPTVGAIEGPRRLVVLVDTSASLGARTGTSTAYAELRDALRRGLDDLPGHVEVRLALCGAGVSVHRGNRAEILAALPAAAGGLGDVDLVAIAAALADEETAIWTLTDGLGPTRPPTVGALSLFGVGGANLAITGCEVDDRWPMPDVRIRVEVRRFGPGVDRVLLEVSGAVAVTEPVQVDLASGPAAVELELRRDSGGWLELSIADSAGLLPADDRLRIWLPEPPAPDIAVLAGAETGRAIKAAALALADETGGKVVDAGADRAGFLLVDGGHLERMPSRAITFGTTFGVRRSGPVDIVDEPVVIDWDREDALTRGLDLSELRFGKALRATAMPLGKTVIQGDAGPLVIVVDRAEGALVHVACRLGDTNLPLLPAFPQLLRRAYARSYGRAAVPRMAPDNLLSAAESDLQPRAALSQRALPSFGRHGDSLVVPLLLLALFALVARVYA